jgi:cytochrome c-type biogenesis protein CcmH
MKSRSRQFAAVVTLGLVLSSSGAAQTYDKAAFQRVSDKLICQCGCHYGLTHCPHLDCPSAPKMRKAIQEKLAAGLSEEQVLTAMVAEFGPAALAAPPAEGFNLTAWVMPFVALLAGLFLVVLVIRRLATPAPAAPAPAAGPAPNDQFRARAERELKRLEE